MRISNSIAANEHKRLKNKLLLRTFVYIPITISFALYLYSSLIQREMRDFNNLFYLIAVTLITVSILWIFMDTDKQIKKEKQREVIKKKKSKARITIEYGLTTLLLIILIAYALFIG
ncbi:hypothetical protein [Virgibacillus salexigens]|uniref:Uncharacterized protein n=1 Tax=Virgibacillus massiliensis TaxID=1462526 RepID=A0A024QGV6_9BACI|nr:hypothetical protein [Virgibacillus massiliensis]CDQ41739.1 hypothetical protein BN990_04116 [Virgibacillus massiliensis]